MGCAITARCLNIDVGCYSAAMRQGVIIVRLRLAGPAGLQFCCVLAESGLLFLSINQLTPLSSRCWILLSMLYISSVAVQLELLWHLVTGENISLQLVNNCRDVMMHNCLG